MNNIQNYAYSSFTGFLPSKTTLTFRAGIGAKSYITSLGMKGKGKQNNVSINVLGESLVKLDVRGKIIQSVSDITDLSLTGGYIKNLKNDDRYLISGNATFNDIFDDEYSYEGPFIESSLTQTLPWQMSIMISGTYEYRKYTDRPAYNIKEEIISDERTDKLLNASISLNKSFENFDIGLDYNYFNNSTNDEFYNFENNIFSIEAGVGF